MGANSPEAFGGYYAWGETKTKTKYTRSNYSYEDRTIGKDIAGTKYDVAHVKWGGSWQMPTNYMCLEMMDNCLIKYTTINNVKGVLCTSHNGASIFIPAGGMYDGSQLRGKGDDSCCWSSTYDPPADGAYPLLFLRGSPYIYSYNRYLGFNVRPVSK